MNAIQTYSIETWSLIAKMGPYLLLGFFIAGLLLKRIQPRWIEQHPRIALTRIRKIYLLTLAGFSLSLSGLNAQELTCQTLDGETLSINQWPLFVITSRSEDDLSETLRCASLVSSLETPYWLIDFNWPQSELVKHIAARSNKMSSFMKRHSTILQTPISDSQIISLIDSQRKIIWSSATYPSDEDWNKAVELFRENR